MSPKVALVYRRLRGLSGVPGLVYLQAEMLRAAGCAVDLVSQRVDRVRLAALGLGWRRVAHWPPRRWDRAWFRRRADALAREYDFVIGHGHHCRADLVWLHNCVAAEAACAPGSVSPADVALQDEVLEAAAARRLLLANSRLALATLAARRPAGGTTAVLYPPFDERRFDVERAAGLRAAARAELGIDEATTLVGWVTSGAAARRGLDVLLQAWHALAPERRRAARLLLVGVRAAPAGVDGTVLWRPPRPDVERYYAALDMAVHPACFEAFGLTVVEMMACGVPVWLPRTVGAAELLPAAAQAGLPARAEPARLAADLAAWLADPELRARWRAWGLAAVAPCRLAAHREAFFGYCRRAGLVLPPG